MSGNNTQPPDELMNQFTIGFEGNALSCILYGIYVAIVGTNLALLRKRRYRILLCFTLFQLLITTLYLVISLYSEPTQLLSIFGLFGVNAVDALSPWHAQARDAAFLINTWTSDAFLLYRCYVVCMGNRLAVVIPTLIYLATISASIKWLVVDSTPGAVYSSRDVQVAGTVAFSCSVAMNVTASVIISARLLLYRRAISQAAGSQQGRFYLSYLAMTLESAVLYTVCVAITLALFTVNSPLQAVSFSVLGVVQVIAPSLIIYRIVRGISFDTDAYGGNTVGTLRFASAPLRGQAGTRDMSDISKTMQLSSGRSAKSNLEKSSMAAHHVKRGDI